MSRHIKLIFRSAEDLESKESFAKNRGSSSANSCNCMKLEISMTNPGISKLGIIMGLISSSLIESVLLFHHRRASAGYVEGAASFSS